MKQTIRLKDQKADKRTVQQLTFLLAFATAVAVCDIETVREIFDRLGIEYEVQVCED